MRADLRSRLPRDAIRVAAAVYIGWVWLFFLSRPDGQDAHAYWALELANPYQEARLHHTDAYLYSPLFAQALTPLRLLPWDLFYAAWTLLQLGALVAMTGFPVAALLLMIPSPFTPVFNEIWVGNIHVFMALAIVVGFRFPATWSFVLLTKVTPGIGLAWFAARREWRSLFVALGVTAGLVAASWAASPGLWAEWLTTLAANSQSSEATPALPIRVLLAVALLVWGARTDRRWVVPVAALIALPVIWGNALALLVAVIPLVRRRRGAQGALVTP